MISTILTKKLVTSIAYTLIGSEVVKKNVTPDCWETNPACVEWMALLMSTTSSSLLDRGKHHPGICCQAGLYPRGCHTR